MSTEVCHQLQLVCFVAITRELHPLPFLLRSDTSQAVNPAPGSASVHPSCSLLEENGSWESSPGSSGRWIIFGNQRALFRQQPGGGELMVQFRFLTAVVLSLPMAEEAREDRFSGLLAGTARQKAFSSTTLPCGLPAGWEGQRQKHWPWSDQH